MTYAVVDVEATGFANTDRVLQVAVVTLDDALTVTGTWVSYVDPQQRSLGPVHIHGITHRQLVGAPTFAAIAGDVLEHLAGHTFVAHNVPYDRRMLANELQRCGLDWSPLDTLDTMQLARRAGLPAKLGELTAALGIPHPHHHDALEDAKVTVEVLRRLQLPEPSPSTRTSAPPAAPGRPELRPRGWTDLRDLRGWEITYLQLGARLAGHDPVPLELRRQLGHTFVAAALPTPASADTALTHWASVILKLLQRGDAPPVPSAVVPDPHPAEVTAADVRAVLHSSQACDLDPSYDLDPGYEQPLWDHVRETHPHLTRWITPQAPFGALTATHPEEKDSTDTSACDDRRVDFLVDAPGMARPHVLEVDGAQHDRETATDTTRDRQLAAAGLTVSRHRQPDLGSAGDTLTSLLATVAADLGAAPGTDATTSVLRRTVLAPQICTQLAYTFTLAALHGALPPSAPWHVDLDLPADIDDAPVTAALTLLTAVDELYDVATVPDVVRTGTRIHPRTAAGWTVTAAGDVPPAEPHLRVLIDPATAPHAALPAPAGTPTVVVRTAWVPASGAWATPWTAAPRPATTDIGQAEHALHVLVSALYGHPGFRPGQLSAVLRALSRADAAVLLPTGAGKSLIYQLAGLLQPGTSIVVAPIIALIDDQVRRLAEQGIDRVLGLHSAARTGRDELTSALADGAALFCLVTPERLQTSEFRAVLRNAAARTPVNLAVVDEAHCVSEWGHDFRTSYLRLGDNLRTHAADRHGTPPPLLALTATASPAVLRDMLIQLGMHGQPDVLQQAASFDRPNLTFKVRAAPPTAWQSALNRTVSSHAPAGAGLVFVPTVNGARGVVAAAAALRSTDGQADIYAGSAPKGHGHTRTSWEQHKRDVASRFVTGELDLLTTTKAFGMGIDKPDVRWTVHLGVPSSIEAFAQEAGRAGRDGHPAVCTLITIRQAPPEVVRHALQPLPDNSAQEALTKFRDDDVSTQLFFHQRSFQGRTAEYQALRELVSRLTRSVAWGPGATLTLPFEGASPSDADARSLYRLVRLGVLVDFTVEYGRRHFELHVGDLANATFDAALLEQVRLTEPSRLHAASSALAAAPTDTAERIVHHGLALLAMLYRTVGPSRIRALAEMYDLATNSRSPEEVRERILAYLSEGPISGVLLEAATAPHVDVAAFIRGVELYPPATPHEWAGASGRLLQTYPRHPLLLTLRAVGELRRPDPSRDVFRQNLAAAFDELEPHDVAPPDRDALFSWLWDSAAAYLPDVGFPWHAGLLALYTLRSGPTPAAQAAARSVLRDHSTAAETSAPALLDASRATLLAGALGHTTVLAEQTTSVQHEANPPLLAPSPSKARS